jgi:tRNA (mo5U34)-methyltransferase
VDLERRDVPPDLLAADVCHHVGVLYHLTDPVRHLLDLGRWVSRGIMLDTHYATPEQVDDEYEVDGERYRVLSYPESGRPDPFSGMHLHAKWLLREDIERVLRKAGFDTVEIVENRSERNGERVLLFAERTA